MDMPECAKKLVRSPILAGVSPWLLLVAVALMMFSGGWHWDRLGAGLVVAAAAMLSGGVIGFIFGVPRTRTDDTAASGDQQTQVSANTNLEQISDWLTKILVGVGLTQFPAIGKATGDLFGHLAPAFGGQAKGKVFAGGLVLFSALFGFVAGWLQARLNLGKAMAAADRDTKAALKDLAKELHAEAERLKEAGDQPAALRMEAKADLVMAKAAEISAAYDTTRATKPTGPERTADLDRHAADARRMARAMNFEPDKVRKMLSVGELGSRMVALTIMGVRPETFDFDGVVSAVFNPRSNDEQYQALLAAQSALPMFTADERRVIRSAAEHVLKTVRADSARVGVAEAIVAGASE